MREHKDHVKTTITLKDNTLKLVLTNANHIYVEAEDGWMHRGRRYRFTAHVTFNGKEWEVQPDLGYHAIHCPDATALGRDTMTAAMLLALNTVVIGREWFENLRAKAEATECNNGILRADEKIAEMEKQLETMKAQRQELLVAEASAEAGHFAPFYIKG